MVMVQKTHNVKRIARALKSCQTNVNLTTQSSHNRILLLQPNLTIPKLILQILVWDEANRSQETCFHYNRSCLSSILITIFNFLIKDMQWLRCAIFKPSTHNLPCTTFQLMMSSIQMVQLSGIQMAFEYPTIGHPTSFQPFEFSTSSVFRSQLYNIGCTMGID